MRGGRRGQARERVGRESPETPAAALGLWAPHLFEGLRASAERLLKSLSFRLNNINKPSFLLPSRTSPMWGLRRVGRQAREGRAGRGREERETEEREWRESVPVIEAIPCEPSLVETRDSRKESVIYFLSSFLCSFLSHYVLLVFCSSLAFPPSTHPPCLRLALPARASLPSPGLLFLSSSLSTLSTHSLLLCSRLGSGSSPPGLGFWCRCTVRRCQAPVVAVVGHH